MEHELANEWAMLLKKTMAIVQPELYQELNDDGELDNFIARKTADAISEYEAYRKTMPDAVAREIVMNDFLPKEDDLAIAEDYEIDGALEDEAAEFGDLFG